MKTYILASLQAVFEGEAMKSTAGITEQPLDKLQPFRVWSKGKIVFFARTKEEADKALRRAQKK